VIGLLEAAGLGGQKGYLQLLFVAFVAVAGRSCSLNGPNPPTLTSALLMSTSVRAHIWLHLQGRAAAAQRNL
jgi:hypothetical protein